MLVAGAGFGGLSAVSGLAGHGFAVTLADRHIYSAFQPLLYQVATAGLAPSDVAYPLRGFAQGAGPGSGTANWPASTPRPGWPGSPTAGRPATTT